MIYESKIARLKFNLKTLKLVKAATGKDPLNALSEERDVVQAIEFGEAIYNAGCISNGSEPVPGFDDLEFQDVADIISAFVRAYTQTVPVEGTATHSQGKQVQLEDPIKIGYGALGLHPWEFDEYTYEDFLYKFSGYQEDRLEFVKALEGIVNWAAYCQIMPTVDKKYKKITVDKIVPSRYEEPKKKSATKETQAERIARHLKASREMDKKRKKNAGQ